MILKTLNSQISTIDIEDSWFTNKYYWYWRLLIHKKGLLVLKHLNSQLNTINIEDFKFRNKH